MFIRKKSWPERLEQFLRRLLALSFNAMPLAIYRHDPFINSTPKDK
jgi:hypothetical protein